MEKSAKEVPADFAALCENVILPAAFKKEPNALQDEKTVHSFEHWLQIELMRVTFEKETNGFSFLGMEVPYARAGQKECGDGELVKKVAKLKEKECGKSSICESWADLVLRYYSDLVWVQLKVCWPKPPATVKQWNKRFTDAESLAKMNTCVMKSCLDHQILVQIEGSDKVKPKMKDLSKAWNQMQRQPATCLVAAALLAPKWMSERLESCFDKYCPEEKKGNFHIQPPGENWVTALFIKRINF